MVEIEDAVPSNPSSGPSGTSGRQIADRGGRQDDEDLVEGADPRSRFITTAERRPYSGCSGPRSPLRASPGRVAGRALGHRKAPDRIAKDDLMHLRRIAPLVLGLVPARIELSASSASAPESAITRSSSFFFAVVSLILLLVHGCIDSS
jgi:hypothetical protein